MNHSTLKNPWPFDEAWEEAARALKGHETTPSSPVLDVLDQAKTLFLVKNAGYRTGADTFAAFTDNGLVRAGKLTPLQYALTLCSKQWEAAEKRVFEEELNQEDLRERLRDVLVYCAIMIALLDEQF